MGEYQTTVQDVTAIVRGSGKIEVAAYQDYPGGYFADPGSGGPEWFNVGAASGINIEELVETAEEENDNTENDRRATRQQLKGTFVQHEPLNLDVWKTLRESLDTITDTSDSFKVKSGNKSEIPKFVFRITVKNDGRPFYLIGYRCNITKGFTFALPADDADDRRVKNPVEFECLADSLYNDGLVYEFEVQGGV